MVIGVVLLVVGVAATWWSVAWLRLWAVLRREPLRSPADLVEAAAAGALEPGPYVVGGTAAPGGAVLSTISRARSSPMLANPVYPRVLITSTNFAASGANAIPPFPPPVGPTLTRTQPDDTNIKEFVNQA